MGPDVSDPLHPRSGEAEPCGKGSGVSDPGTAGRARWSLAARGQMLEVCPRGNHRDDDIPFVSMIYIVFIEYPLKAT